MPGRNFTVCIVMIAAMSDTLRANLEATYDNCNNFNIKLKETLLGLINENGDRKSEIEALRADHEELKKNFGDFQTSAERENDLRKNEIRSLEDKQAKDNQVQEDKATSSAITKTCRIL